VTGQGVRAARRDGRRAVTGVIAAAVGAGAGCLAGGAWLPGIILLALTAVTGTAVIRSARRPAGDGEDR